MSKVKITLIIIKNNDYNSYKDRDKEFEYYEILKQKNNNNNNINNNNYNNKKNVIHLKII